MENRRVRSEETIDTLKQELLTQNWDSVYQETDIGKAYEAFLEIFIALYNKRCPTKECNRKKVY